MSAIADGEPDFTVLTGMIECDRECRHSALTLWEGGPLLLEKKALYDMGHVKSVLRGRLFFFPTASDESFYGGSSSRSDYIAVTASLWPSHHMASASFLGRAIIWRRPFSAESPCGDGLFQPSHPVATASSLSRAILWRRRPRRRVGARGTLHECVAWHRVADLRASVRVHRDRRPRSVLLRRPARECVPRARIRAPSWRAGARRRDFGPVRQQRSFATRVAQGCENGRPARVDSGCARRGVRARVR